MRKFALALGVSLLAAQAGAVTPVVTTQTRSGTLDFGLLLGGSNITLNFDAFGIPTQRLTNVALSFTAGASAGFAVTNPNVTPRSVTLTRGLSGSLTGNGFNLSDTDTVSITRNVAALSVRGFGPFEPQVSASGNITSGFAAFNSPVSFTFNVARFGDNLTRSPGGGLPPVAVLDITQPVSSSYTATLTYTSVPEPAAWAMLITGFGLAGIAARRRRATSVAA